MGSNPNHIKLKHRGPIIGTYEKRSVIRCEPCGFAHLHPLPYTNAVQEYYKRGFYEDDKPDYLEREQGDLEWLTEVVYPIQFELVGNGSLLDAGCGYGTFLKEAKRRGYKVFGIEASPKATQYLAANDLSHMTGFVEDIDFAVGQGWDIIRAAWLLEHVADARRVVEKLVKWLAPGGRLLVIVPNDFSAMQLALKRECYWIGAAHVNYFDIPSLKGLLESVGLTVTDTLATYPMEIFLLTGMDYVNNEAKGQAAHNYRKSWELRMPREIIMRLQRGYAAAGVGRDIVMVGRK